MEMRDEISSFAKRASAMATTNRGQRSCNTLVCSLFRTCSPCQSRITLLCERMPVCVCVHVVVCRLPTCGFITCPHSHTLAGTPTAAAMYMCVYVCVNWWHINFQLKSALSKHSRFQYWTSTGPVLCNFMSTRHNSTSTLTDTHS